MLLLKDEIHMRSSILSKSERKENGRKAMAARLMSVDREVSKHQFQFTDTAEAPKARGLDFIKAVPLASKGRTQNAWT